MHHAQQSTFTDLLKSIPAMLGIRLDDEPRYELVTVLEGDVEIRRYDPVVLAQISLSGAHDDAVRRGVQRLDRYLAGTNVDGAAIANMTEVREREFDGGWTVSVAISNGDSVAELPPPYDRDIRLVRLAEQVVATVAYRGDTTEERETARARLLRTLEQNPAYRPTTPVFWAQLDGPRALSFIQRSEARVEIDPGGLPRRTTEEETEYAGAWLTAGLPLTW